MRASSPHSSGPASDRVPRRVTLPGDGTAPRSALGRAGRKDVNYYRLAFVDHCPHSLFRVPRLREVVNEFFLRTLVNAEPARPTIKRPAGR